MTRDEAYSLVTSWTTNKNLIKHMLACEAAMRALFHHTPSTTHQTHDEELWGVLGLVHDADYEKYPDVHPKKLIEELEKRNDPPVGEAGERELINGVATHAWNYNGMTQEPKTAMEWSLYCADELTGFIVAVTLIRPSKKIKDVTVEDVLKKWNKKDFAKGVHREQIEMCEEKLGIKLPDFIQIVLTAMKEIDNELGL